MFDLGKPLLKAIDRWRGAYANAVITGLVRIMITYVWQTEKQKGCGVDFTRLGSNYKTSLGWVYGPRYHVILAMILLLLLLLFFLFFEKQN